MIPNGQTIRVVTALAVCLAAACDRSPTALDAVQEDGLRRVIEAAGTAGARSVESDFRDLAWRLATVVEPTPRLPVLEELFERAIERAARDPGRIDGAGLRSEHQALADAAWAAVEAGQQDVAEGALTAARTFMAARTVDILGEPVAAAYVAILGLAIDHAAARAERGTEPVPPRFRRVLATARNLHGDAGDALANSDFTRAIDIASHAAGLLNSLEAPSR